MNKSNILSVTMAGLAFLYLMFIYESRIPPEVITWKNMERCKASIVKYFREEKKLPINIRDIEKYDKQKTFLDGWQQYFQYSVNEGLITLKSFGQDKKIGGEKESKDIEGVFFIDVKSPIYFDGEIKWKKDPKKDLS